MQQEKKGWTEMPSCPDQPVDGKSINCCGNVFSTVAAIRVRKGVFSSGNPIGMILLLDFALVIFVILGWKLDKDKKFALREDSQP